MLDLFIFKEVVIEGRRQLVITLLGIQGIHPYAPFRVLRQFGRIQTTPREAYYGTYVFDIGNDLVHEASEMLREWKGSKRIDKYIISQMDSMPDMIRVTNFG